MGKKKSKSAAVSDKQLVEAAIRAQRFSYAPYSHFCVGAAVLDGEGRLFSGCNIENASYGATICAERAAVAKAVSEGGRQISRIAIVGGGSQPCLPCGICRQVLAEFAAPDLTVLAATPSGHYEEYRLDELLPHAFTLNRQPEAGSIGNPADGADGRGKS